MIEIILKSILISFCITICYSYYDEDHHLMKRFCKKDMSDAVLTKLQACDQFQTFWFINVTNNCLMSLNLGTTFKDRRHAKCTDKIKGKLMKCIRNGRKQQNGMSRDEKGTINTGNAVTNRGVDVVPTVARVGVPNPVASGISNVATTGIQNPLANRLSSVLIRSRSLNQSLSGIPNYRPPINSGITATNLVSNQSPSSTVNEIPNISGTSVGVIDRNVSSNVGTVGQSIGDSNVAPNLVRNKRNSGKAEFGGYRSGSRKSTQNDGRKGHNGYDRKWEGQFEQCIKKALH